MTEAAEKWCYCPFSHPLMVRQFACQWAHEVTRRDGPAIACQQEDAHTICQDLFNVILAATLSAQDLPLDLTKIPSSLLKKIQFGSILALNSQLHGTAVHEPDANAESADSSRIENIYAVVQSAKVKYPLWSLLDLHPLIRFIDSYQLPRRRQSKPSA